ncbi:ComEC/Rec2 family competence protein [Aquirufa lenticrescens]|uniref:ComEC/Rec2 family competence protein n=1 Tax=Aquirufa lenticrescens TaxID=2696560 RepID=UPI001CAA65D7|nr:ComEC/Rec2 family competence protein [Aquirufa lenticrescens]UAJ13800.1 ComEC family competence protein [Aquirufa lenticrescens]
MISYFSRFPFVRILLFWMIGILLSGFDYWLLLGCLGFLLPGRVGKSVGISSLIVVFAMSWAAYLKPVLPVLPGDGFVFRVGGSVEEKPKSWSVLARGKGIRDSSGSWTPMSGLIRLYLAKQLPKPASGDLYAVRQVVKPFPLPLFPYEKDWGAYFTQKGIGGTAFVSLDRIRLLKKGTVESTFFEKAQGHFVGLLERAFEPGRDRDVAEAMLLGVKTKIDFETLSAYSALGAIHILSVSGLHVGLLYMGLSLLLGFLLKRRPAGPYVFFGLMMALLWCYAGISGFSLPVLRSAWMFSVILFAKTFLRRQESLNTLAFSAFVLLFLHPASLFDAGFQLSYLAVWGLIAFQQRWASVFQFSGWLRWPLTQIWELTCVALAAQIFTWPLIVYYFHQLPHPISFFLLNPFLILFSSIALFLGFLLLAIGSFLPEWAFQPLAYLLKTSFQLLHGLMFSWVERVTSVMPFLRISWFEMGSYFTVIALLVWAPRRWKVCAFITLIFWQTPETIPQSYLSSVKGEAVWVENKGEKSFASLPASTDPAWIQAHLSPMWANVGVTDTLTRRWPEKGNLQWKYRSETYAYVREPTEATGQQYLILGKEVKYRDKEWLISWQKATWYFLKKPSAYWLGELKPYLPQKYYFLDEQSAIVL